MFRLWLSALMIIGIGGRALAGAAPATMNFSKDAVGKEPSLLACVVGFWRVTKDGDQKVLMVNGSRQSSGQPGFPLCVAKGVEKFSDGEISFRFKPVAGRVDQGAGIVFDLRPNGDYLILRANALENNLILFRYARGERSSLKVIESVPTPTGRWQTLKLTVKGKNVQGALNGKTYLEYELPAPVSGKVGVWSKADSMVYFDDIKIDPK